MDKQEILKKVKEDKVQFINLQFTDIVGGIKSVAIPVNRLEEALEEGVWFDGSSIEGFVRIHESDMILKPDPNTYALLPWQPEEKAIARFICDVYRPDGNPFEGDPRYILKKQLERAAQLGFIYNTGPEVEFFLLKKEDEKITAVPHDVGGYFDYSAKDLASDLRLEIAVALEKLGLTVEMSHHEVAFGQHEIDIQYSDALKTADNVITLKHTIKEMAKIYDLYATFMPKPIFGINGSGMHTHQSLFDIKTSKNVFYDSSDPYRLSKLAYHFIAGQLAYAREICAVVAPTVNSYKRLVVGYEAPVYICWARINRSALIRVPAYSPGREQSTRVELRCPDPSCNPYLAFAVMLSAGLEGIIKKLEPPDPVEEDVYEFDNAKLQKLYIKTLPGSLGEAISELEKSELVRNTLGEHTFSRFLEAKKKEWDTYRIQVTDWELKNYLETL